MPKSSGSTIGSSGTGLCDEPYFCLMAGVLRQAALDYKTAVEWLASHPGDMDSRDSVKMQNMKKDVVAFTRSDLFDYAVGDTIEPDVFLKTALTTPIRMNRN